MFAFGFVSGAAFIWLTVWWIANNEWAARGRIETKLDRVYKHLSCGGGVLGCSGGPNCTFDHK